MSVAQWTNKYVFFFLEDLFRSSYGKLILFKFESTATQFGSDTLTNWDIKLWAQLALWSKLCTATPVLNFVQCSEFISVIPFVSLHIHHSWNLAQVITWMQRDELIHDTYGIHNWKIFILKAAKNFPEWNLNLRLLNSAQTL